MPTLMSKAAARQFLEDGRHGWGADKHAVNHFKEHVWFKSCPGGFTECCDFGNECDYHAKMCEEAQHG